MNIDKAKNGLESVLEYCSDVIGYRPTITNCTFGALMCAVLRNGF